MHEAGEAEIPALLLAFAIIVLVTLGIVHRVKAITARKVEIRRLQRLAAEEAARVEEQAAEELTSMLSTSISFPSYPRSLISNPPAFQELPAVTASLVRQTSSSTSSRLSSGLGVCAVCSTPTKKQCSRCKAIKYCSQQCQFRHWREGHKQECHELEKTSITTVTASHASPLENSIRLVNHEEVEANGSSTEERLLVPLKASRTLTSITPDGSLPKPKKILFPYEYFVEFFISNRLKLPPCGLINCGNSCFANVVLQCLTYTRPLAAYLLQGSHTEECQRNDWCFMCELEHHVTRVGQSQIPFSPIKILSQIRNIGNHLGYGRQEDAHEFMRFAIDSMQSICLDEVGGEKAVDQRTQETTLIHHIFGGHLQSQVRCMQCHHKSHRYEKLMDLAVEIQGNVETLEDALSQFTAPEWLDGENKYKCDRCNAYVKACKRLVIHEAPNILTVALKRFQSGKFGKLNKRVTFPEILDMSPYMSEDGDKPPHYELYAVVVHVDMLNASFFGHYICYVKDLEGSWYKIDDSKVKEVDVDKVMQQKAYMLLYTRSAPRYAPVVDDGGMQPPVKSHTDSCSSRTAQSNGHHTLSDASISNVAANENGSISYRIESNGVLSSGNSNSLEL